MKKFNIILYASMAWMLSFQLTAQRKVPYNFHYPLNVTDSVVLRKVTTVSYPNTTALRLYFEDAYLGERSYLLLEGIDGAQQRLDAMTLKNWNYSSAYFNGGQATVSVYQSPGDSITFKIAALKVNERQEEAKDQQARKTAIQSTGNAKMAQLEEVEMPPYAAAVGRITNGNDARATVWIAANGAIVTHLGFATGEDGEGVYNYTGFDVVEFNVPQSNADGSVNHPAPEDQYPLNIEHITWNKIEGTWGPKKRILIKPYFGAGTGNERTWGGYAVVEALPNGTGKRPGERIQEYFQVTRHPSGPVMEGRRLDVFHHGFIKDNPMSQTLQMKKLEAYNPRDYLMFVMDKDRFLVYDEPGRRGTPWHQQRLGAPVTYEGSNVAVGIHTEALISGPLFGTGFRDEKFRQDLGGFFSSQMVYVDQASYWDTGNGKIDRPYLTVSEAAGKV